MPGQDRRVAWWDARVDTPDQLPRNARTDRLPPKDSAKVELVKVGDAEWARASGVVFGAWTSPDATEAHRQLQSIPVPGPIALRSRYRHLMDSECPPPVANAALTRARWDRIMGLEMAADAALIEQPLSAAEPLSLLAHEEVSSDLRIITIHAMQGLGDMERQADHHEEAARHLTEAHSLSVKDGYRFGEMRALVSLGYLSMVATSVGEAATYFERALRLATDIPDALFEANAALGSAECSLRLKDYETARSRAESSLDVFADLRSHVGAGNAAERLASILRALNDPEGAKRVLGIAARHFGQAGAVIGQVNALDNLGELHLDTDELPSAYECFREAFDLAEGTYSRGSFNALLGLGRVAHAEGQTAAAIQAYRQASDGFRSLHDLVGQMRAYDGLARCARVESGPASELAVRVESVQQLEQIRASHHDKDTQAEYAKRFTLVYGETLRLAVELDDVEAGVFVLECLCGRRVAGLLESVPPSESSDLRLADHIAAMADQRLAGRLPPVESREERVRRLLGAVALKSTMAAESKAAIHQLAASAFLPLDPAEAESLLEVVPTGAHMVMLALGPLDSGQLTYVWRRPDRSAEIGSFAVPVPTLHLLESLVARGTRSRTVHELEPLRHLLPGKFVESLSDFDDDAVEVLLIPIGSLRLIPWAALAVSNERVLGEVADIVLSPSLTANRQVAGRASNPSAGQTAMWRNSTLANHEYRVSQALGRRAMHVDDDALMDRVLRANPGGRAVVVGHGREVPGAFYLELEPGNVVTTSEMLEAAPPERLALISCWGAVDKYSLDEDPLSLAVVALVAGSHQVLATVGELADSFEATWFVRRILRDPAERLSTAVRNATRAHLAEPGMRDLPVGHWAPIVTLASIGEVL